MSIWPWSDDEKAVVAETSDEDPRDCGCEDDEEEKADDTEDGEEEPVQVDVRVMEILRKRHTVHLGEAEFTDGDTKRFMFDAMKRKGGAIVLYDYTNFTGRGYGKEAFVTIPPDNLKTFETVRREEVRVRTGKRARDMGPFDPEQAEEYAEEMRQNENIESAEVLN